MCTLQPRYSVFGWFLQPGQLYELFQGTDSEVAAQSTPDHVTDDTEAACCPVGVCPIADTHSEVVVIHKKQRLLLSTSVQSTHELSTLLSSKSLPDTRERFSRLYTL